MARKSIADFLKKSLPTVRKIIAELKSVGLLKEKRTGLTKCNKIYVQLLPGESEIYAQSVNESDIASAKKPDFSLEGKPFASNNGNSKNINKNGYVTEDKKEKSTGWRHEKPPKQQKGVLAQQYEQREYTREFLYGLFDVI
jgi:hypothetical protein